MLCAAFLIPLLVLSDEKKPTSKTTSAVEAEIKAHEGVWKPVSAIMGGRRIPPPALKEITLKITGDKYEVTADTEAHADKGYSVLDPAASPKRMSTTSTDGPNKGKTFLAIYEFKDENTLRICYDLSGAEYPKEFKAPQGTMLYLVTYKRQKKE